MTTGFDLEALRAQFPILHVRPHGQPLHYLDNAATSQIPKPVLDAIIYHEMTARANVKRSVHFLAEAATNAFDDARTTMARYLNAALDGEIVFTSGCTGAINLLAHSFGNLLKAEDEILLSVTEHHSNIVPWQLLAERRNLQLKWIPVLPDGQLDLDAAARLITSRTRAFAVTHASNVTGAETNLSQVVTLAKACNARIFVDGAQRAPHGPIDVQALGIDAYALSGHKMFGPNGVGILWAKSELLNTMPPFLGGGEMIARVGLQKTTYAPPPHRFEAGTPPIAQAIGLAAAARWISTLDHEAIHQHLLQLTGYLLDGLTARQKIQIIGPTGLQSRLPVVSFVVDGAHPHDICQILDRHGVALRGGHHCAQPFMDILGISGTTRVSLACYNQKADIDALFFGLDHAIEKLCR